MIGRKCIGLPLQHQTFLRCLASQVQANQQPQPLKEFTEIPAPKGIPLLGTLISQWRGGVMSGKMIDYFSSREKELGPIFRENLGPTPAIWISSPEIIKEFFRKESKYPRRFPFDSMRLHREQSGRGYGLFLHNDEEWHAHRSALNKHMMRPQNVATHLGDFNNVAIDFIKSIEDEHPNEAAIPDMRTKLFNWSLESALTVLFETRVGCFGQNRDSTIQGFVDSVHEVLDTSEVFFTLPPRLAKSLRLPIWQRHYDSWEKAFDIADLFVRPLINEAKRKVEQGEEAVGITASMVIAGNIADHEILASIMTLMSAAIDTTSTSVYWLLLLLGQNPDIQDKLRDEIRSVIPSGEELSIQHINQLKYLKATLKESMRLHPVTPIFSRVTTEDLDIGGYKVPKETLIVILSIANRDKAEIYKQPDKFKPERWLRGGGEEPDPHANLPFGHGTRMCIGRRIAELEIQTLLCQLLLKKKIVLENPNYEIREVNKVLLVPESDIAIKLEDY